MSRVTGEGGPLRERFLDKADSLASLTAPHRRPRPAWLTRRAQRRALQRARPTRGLRPGDKATQHETPFEPIDEMAATRLPG